MLSSVFSRLHHHHKVGKDLPLKKLIKNANEDHIYQKKQQNKTNHLRAASTIYRWLRTIRQLLTKARNLSCVCAEHARITTTAISPGLGL